MNATPVLTALAQSTAFFDAIGMLAFALAGILAAQGRDVDPVGVFIVAFTSAFGGVTVRDLLLDIRPFQWITSESVSWVIIAFTIFAPVIVKRLSSNVAREVFLWAEAAGLGIFCASGTVLAWERDVAPLSCTILGVATGISGGVFRDVLLRRVPAALSDRKPYGLAGFIGCWLAVILLSDGVHAEAVVAVTATTILLVRMFTLKVNWEIRYNTALARRIFPKAPGTGVVSRMMRRVPRTAKPRMTRTLRPRRQDAAPEVITPSRLESVKAANRPRGNDPEE